MCLHKPMDLALIFSWYRLYSKISVCLNRSSKINFMKI